MTLRSVLSFLAAYVTWVVAFWSPIFLTSIVWLPLQQTGQQFWAEQRYDIFPTDQLVLFQVVWLFANGAVGFVSRLVAKRDIEVYVVAGLLFVYFAYNHWWALWGVMPDWYNFIVVIPVIPMVLAGSAIAKRFANRWQVQTT